MKHYAYHIIYKTTNLINGKIYVGFHSTDDLEDSYLGSGWILKAAIKKYGKENFKREILMVCPTREEAREVEACLVDELFVKRPDTYNTALGGMGVEDQCGTKNHRYGLVGTNAKKLIGTHRDGRIIQADSIQHMAYLIGLARGNVRALIKKGIHGKKCGWLIREAA